MKILPVVVLGTSYAGIVPVYDDNGRLAIRVRATPVSQLQVSPGYTGLMSLDISERNSHINTNGDWGIGSQLTFLGANGEDVVMTEEMNQLYFGEESRLGFGISADIYSVFRHGFMLYPGRLRADFSEDARMSMILNPQNPVDDGFCIPGSLFYTRRNIGSIAFFWWWSYRNIDTVFVNTKLIRNGALVESSHYSWIEYDIDPSPSDEISDSLPLPIAIELKSLLIRPLTSDYVDNCDLRNVNYPSIHFVIADRHRGEFEHKGTIVYGPEDYLEGPTEDGRCRIKIGSGRGRFGKNFYNKVATHFQSDHIGFCDPA